MSSHQQQQFDLDFSQKRPPEVQAKIAEGMAAADEHADPFWKRVLDGCILAVARRLPELTVDDVLGELEAVNRQRKANGQEIVETHHLCAIGPAMKRARTDGIITPTDRVKRSAIPHKNGNLHTIWRSNFTK